jgi:hypothetical protein
MVPLDDCSLTGLFLLVLAGETLGLRVTFFFIGQHQRPLIAREAVLFRARKKAEQGFPRFIPIL